MPKYMIIGRNHDYTKEPANANYSEISIPEMKKTGQFQQEYKFRFLARPMAKHDFTTEQFILWEKDNGTSNEKWEELYKLIEGFSKADYMCRRNNISTQSIPLTMHYHIAKFIDVDNEIISKLL